MTSAWPDYPTRWASPGHIPRGHENEAILDRLAVLPPLLIAAKTADETITSNATYQDDDHLFVPVEAGGTYVYFFRGAYNSGATPDFACRFSVPSGSFSANYLEYFDASNAMVRTQFTDAANGGSGGFAGKATDTPLEIGGVYTCGSTGGFLRFQWKQDVSNASNTVVRAGSRLQAVRTA